MRHILIGLFIAWMLPGFSQFIFFDPHLGEEDSIVESGKRKKKEKNYTWIALPTISANPTNGFMYGLSGTVSWFMGNAATTTLSDANGSILYTSKKQSLNTFRSNLFLRDDQWILKGDWRFLMTSLPTYGLGTGPQSAKPVANGTIEYADGLFAKPIPDEQMLHYDYLRIHEVVLRRWKESRLFLGMGYHLDFFADIKDKLLDLEADTAVITSHYAYSVRYGFNPEQYVLSGVSLSASYDSRDNPVFPVRGRYAYVTFRINPTFLGSDKNSTILWVEYRDYLNLSSIIPRHLIGFWVYANIVTTGEAPYLGLPATGWDHYNRSGRGYVQGRFRGQELIYGEAEYRFPIPLFKKHPDLLGAVVFVNGTTATNHDAGIELFEYLDYAYGFGLRIMFSKKTMSNLVIDYAIGKYGSSGFYLNINETF